MFYGYIIALIHGRKVNLYRFFMVPGELFMNFNLTSCTGLREYYNHGVIVYLIKALSEQRHFNKLPAENRSDSGVILTSTTFCQIMT